MTSGGLGLASFKADGSGVVRTSGNTAITANAYGNATYESVEYYGGGTTDIIANSNGNASMLVTATGGNRIQSLNTMTIRSNGSGNASFSAPTAGTVKVTGAAQDLNIITTSSGKASFTAEHATVSVEQGNLNINSSASTTANGTASLVSDGLNIAGTTTIIAGVATATANITGVQVSTGNLTVTAGANTASFTANGTDMLNVNVVNVNGAAGTGGDAKIIALNAEINSSGDPVTISTAGTTGGTKGVYADRLQTGRNQLIPGNNASVTMTGTGTGASSAQLVLTDSLQTGVLNLTGVAGNAAAVNTNINRVDVTYIDTIFNFNNTVASTDSGASGVYFKTIDLGAHADAASPLRTLNATNATLGTYWADTLKVNVTTAASAGHNWIGDIWLGGSPTVVATGTIGQMDFILPAGSNLTDYLGDGNGATPTTCWP